MSWVSTNGGKTFAVGQPPVDADSFAGELLVTPSGYLALGQEGPERDIDARAWRSVNGAEWEEVDLGSPRTEGPGAQSYVTALLDKDQLRLVGRDVPPEGGGYYTITLPLPRD